ncbi:hypothetical protein TrCOL_g826 [Triparma columacea]|uniref:Uncharacterized protein n=1 Tax=Triparma columacea TaxID=722753 RepID=A0A9W7G749_9STRA|nr:hypothetical protein TrCOL_g826 [Triparma columacea]
MKEFMNAEMEEAKKKKAEISKNGGAANSAARMTRPLWRIWILKTAFLWSRLATTPASPIPSPPRCRVSGAACI